MADFLLNFYGGGGQAVALAAALAVWIGVACIGGLVGGRDRLTEADPFVGWAVVVAVVTVSGVFVGVPFRWPAAALAAAAAVGAFALLRRDGFVVAPSAPRMAVLGAPMLLLVSAMAASQWDEFSHWLPSARYLYLTDAFPDAADPVTGATYPAYPYGWPLVTYLASVAAGGFVEGASAITNVLILLTIGLLAVRLIRDGLDAGTAPPPGWALCALGGLAATLLNPTFVQKVALTAYADVATAAAVAFGGVLGWRMLGAIADGAPTTRGLALQFGLVMMVLVNLKQATFVLFVLLVVAVGCAGLADGRVRARWRALAGALPWMTVPPLVLYGVWRYHVATQLAGAEFTLRPVSEWFVALVPEILATMALVLAKKSGYLALMTVAVALGVRAMVRMRTPLDRLAMITGFLFLSYNAFLLLMYVAAFGRDDALRVASLWRYNMHLGLLGIAFAAYAGGAAWRRLGWRRDRPSLGALAVCLMVAAPVAFADKLRFDREPTYRHYRTVGAESAPFVGPADRYFVLDPAGTGESAVIVRYEIGRPRALLGYVSAFQDVDKESLAEMLRTQSPDRVVVFSVDADIVGAVGLELRSGHSYLLAAADGDWTIVRSWPHPDG